MQKQFGANSVECFFRPKKSDDRKNHFKIYNFVIRYANFVVYFGLLHKLSLVQINVQQHNGQIFVTNIS